MSVYPTAVDATPMTGGGAAPSNSTSSPLSAAPTTYCGEAGVMIAATYRSFGGALVPYLCITGTSSQTTALNPLEVSLSRVSCTLTNGHPALGTPVRPMGLSPACMTSITASYPIAS